MDVSFNVRNPIDTYTTIACAETCTSAITQNGDVATLTRCSTSSGNSQKRMINNTFLIIMFTILFALRFYWSISLREPIYF